MANFFQPGDAESSGTKTSTPSAAEQALMKFKAQLLAQLLNSRAGNRPTFKSFVNGGPVTTPLPEGMGSGMTDVINAMNQPGAFTSNGTQTQTGHGPTPSMANDVGQMLGLGVLGLQVLNMLKGKYGDTGTVQGVTNPTNNNTGNQGNSMTTGNPALDALILNNYGGNPEMTPGGDFSQVPADYPGLADDGSDWLSKLFGG